MRWMKREGGSTGSVRAMRGAVGIALAIAATIAPNAWAQVTQQVALSTCESALPDEYERLQQNYALRGSRCAVTDPANKKVRSK